MIGVPVLLLLLASCADARGRGPEALGGGRELVCDLDLSLAPGQCWRCSAATAREKRA